MRRRWPVIAVIFLILLDCSSALAAVPKTINYQGYLTNAKGEPVNGSVEMLFALYNVQTSGTALWSETQTVMVKRGVYSVILGSITPFDFPFDVQYYLGVAVGADSEMTPRQPLTSVGYAVNSANAEMIGGNKISDLDNRYDSRYLMIPSAPRLLPGQNTLSTVDGTGKAILLASSTSIAVGADGLPIIAYYDKSSRTFRVAHCNDAACTSRNIYIGSSLGSNAGYPSAAIGSDGLPIISFYNDVGSELVILKCGNAACSLNNSSRTISAYNGYETSIALGTDGFPVISFSSSGLNVAKCGNAICSQVVVKTVDTNTWSRYSSIAIGTDGFPVIAYIDDYYRTLKVAKCGDAVCSSGNIIVNVDTGEDVGEYPALTIGSDGLPVISYYDRLSGYLKVLHCGNIACSYLLGNRISSVDGLLTKDPFSSSVTVGTDGLPVIAYYAANNRDLKVAHCGNNLCSSGNVITTLDSTGEVGQYPSITIGSDGFPVISYYDATNGFLKVAKCASQYCTNVFWRR